MAITTESTYLMHVPSNATWSVASESTPASGVVYFTRSGSSPNYAYGIVEDVKPSDNPSSKGWYKPSAWAKLVDIKDFGDLGSEPATVDKTTLSDHAKKYLLGLDNIEKVTFTANYDPTDYANVIAQSGVKHLSVWFGSSDGTTPSGSDGKFSFDGELSVFAKGAGVEAVVDMTITAVVGSSIVF